MILRYERLEHCFHGAIYTFDGVRLRMVHRGKCVNDPLLLQEVLHSAIFKFCAVIAMHAVGHAMPGEHRLKRLNDALGICLSERRALHPSGKYVLDGLNIAKTVRAFRQRSHYVDGQCVPRATYYSSPHKSGRCLLFHFRALTCLASTHVPRDRLEKLRPVVLL